MESCDVVVVGGGPAGASAAAALTRAGADVIVMDRATFPRDKLCAGWITPQVVADLRLDPADYGEGRTWQPITGFRVGVIGSRRVAAIVYDRPVSFAIRRAEFDAYLLGRSGARTRLGAPVASLRREGDAWIVNGGLRAPMLVGAGGHFCPVARWLNAETSRERGALVTAEEIEFVMSPHDEAACPIAPGIPELYFSRDLQGYGWCLRKGAYLNIGFGRRGGHALPAEVAGFVAFLASLGRLPAPTPAGWRGHAYLVTPPRARQVVGEGVLLVGDAAGVACSESGEGIRPAIESGLLAAAVIHEAAPSYAADRLRAYERRLDARLGGQGPGLVARHVPRRLAAALVRPLLRTPRFARRMVLDRWFLRAHEGALA